MKIVIVSCPRCHKQYRLDISRLNYISLPDNSGQGVQLACSNCHEQWWELKKESVNLNQQQYNTPRHEQPFRNLTDISLLYQRQSSNYAYQADPDISFPARGDIRPFPQQPALQTQKTKRWKTLFQIVLWSFIIFSGTIALALVAMQFNPSLVISSEHMSEANTPGEFSIENIQFDVKPIDEERQKVIVIGNIKNPGPLAIPLHNIQLTAWGTCLQEQTPNEQGLCQIRVWPYKWKQDLLQPGEKLTFKSAAKIPANLQVDQVHVDVASN